MHRWGTMSRYPLILVALALSLVGTACSAAGSDDASLGTAPRRATTTPTTVAPVATTTTVVAVPAGPGALVSPTGVVLPVVSHQTDRWTVTTPCGRETTLSVGTFVPTTTVVLDPGHGGSDPGAVSPGGLRESPVNLAVANHTKNMLQAAGVTVLLTRTADYDMNLPVRAQLAKAVGAAAFVSIHHNAEPDGPWPKPGSETYYQMGSQPSKRLAGLIYEETVKALSPYPVAWVADTDAGAKYRKGTNGDYYAVLRQPAPVVSALAELAFISNPAEAELLARPEFQKVEGEAVARAILRYLRTPDPGSGFTEPYERPTPRSSGGPSTPAPCTDPALL
jgi:N-acetylmuramoyl-L-alanine amidase